MRKSDFENIAGVWSATYTLFTNKLELDVEAITCLAENYLKHKNRRTT